MMFEATSFTILPTLDELLYNLFCLTTASVHILSLSLSPQTLLMPHFATRQQCPHEAQNVTDHSFTPGQHNIFIKFFRAEAFVVVLWVRPQRDRWNGHFIYM